MIVLGVDTSTMTGSVALIDGERLLGEITLNIKETHESRLMRTIDLLFNNTKMTPAEVDLYTIGVGPGSFTGLRIGIATVKALAQSSDKPLVGVSSLLALAYNFLNAESFLCPLLDARKGEVYSALFRFEGLRLIRFLTDMVAAPDEILNTVKEITNEESVLFWGSGSDRKSTRLNSSHIPLSRMPSSA